MLNAEEITIGDIVKILADGPECGRFARILKIENEMGGLRTLTLKVNNYWRSSENLSLFGEWSGLLWIAIVLSEDQIQVKKHPGVNGVDQKRLLNVI